MVSINIEKEIFASLELVWVIVSDVDNDPRYWHGTKSLKNIRRTENTVERDVTIAFRNSNCKEIVTIEPMKRVELKITEGPIVGTKNILR